VQQDGVEIRETQGEEGSWDSFREVRVLGGMGMEETRFVNPRICELQALTRKSIYIITFALAVLVYSGVCSYVVHSHLHDFAGIAIYASIAVLLSIIGVYGSLANSIIALRAYAHFLLFDSCITALPRFVLLYFFSTMRELLCHLPRHSPHVYVSEIAAAEVGNCTLRFYAAFGVVTVFVVGAMVIQVCIAVVVRRFIDTLERVSVECEEEGGLEEGGLEGEVGHGRGEKVEEIC
jgi:hypothetical protein